METIAIFVIGLLMFGVILGIYYHFFYNPIIKTPVEQSDIFQGPVPEGYGERYYRKTGLTKPLETN